MLYESRIQAVKVRLTDLACTLQCGEGGQGGRRITVFLPEIYLSIYLLHSPTRPRPHTENAATKVKSGKNQGFNAASDVAALSWLGSYFTYATQSGASVSL